MLILLKTGMYPESIWYMSRLYITDNEIDKGHCVKKNTFVQFSFGSQNMHVKGEGHSSCCFHCAEA